MISPTSLCQIEVQVSDLERACQFYEAVFGWMRVPAEMHEYVVLDVPKDCPFGVSLIMQPAHKPRASSITLYFAVASFEPYLEKALATGGAVALAPRLVPGYGYICHISDPDGQRWGLFRSLAALG